MQPQIEAVKFEKKVERDPDLFTVTDDIVTFLKDMYNLTVDDLSSEVTRRSDESSDDTDTDGDDDTSLSFGSDDGVTVGVLLVIVGVASVTSLAVVAAVLFLTFKCLC